MNKTDLLKENVALLKSGAVTMHNPLFEKLLEQITKYRIRSRTALPEMKHLLNINGVNCFPRGDLVAISGKENCGKTTDCRIIVSALMKGEYLGVKALEEKVRVLWIDTEQASQTSRAVCRGIELMCGSEPPDDRFFYFALREYPNREAMTDVMRALFNEFRPDIAIIDGIRDFIPDFNDVVESAEIVLECMRLSSGVSAEKARETGLVERPPCCVCCILHQNKPKDDNNMRGHLGTELSNKAGEVWEATQDDDHVFTFAQTRSRTRPVDDPLRYKVQSQEFSDTGTDNPEEIGIPELWSTDPDASPDSASESDIQEVPTAYIKTKEGYFAMNKRTAQYMFYKLMGFADWDYHTMKKQFLAMWNIDYYDFNLLVKLTDNHVFSSKVNGRTVWKYNGPTFQLQTISEDNQGVYLSPPPE